MKAIYARVSTEEQAKRGYSLKEQIRVCREKLNNSQDIIEYLDEGVSGEFLDRPGLTKLRNDVRKGLIDTIVCLDPDRLSRKLMNQLLVTEEFEKKAKLIFVNGEYQKTPEGMLFYQMRGAIAEFEKAKITERMSRGRLEKARSGKVLRDFNVYGYDYDQEKQQLIINDYEAKIVKIIFNLFTNPPKHIKGINGIAKYLTEQSIPTKRHAKQWHRQVVRQILQNKAYIGEFYQNRWKTEGMLGNKFREEDEKIKMEVRPKEEWVLIPCPKIIDKEQFEHAQALLKQSRRRWSGKKKHEYLLSGLLRCKDCGNTMPGRKSKNWGKYLYEYLDLKNTAGAKHPGCGNRIKCSEIDKEVWETVRKWLNDPSEILNANKEQSEFSSFEHSELDHTNKELERVKVGRERLLNILTTEDEINLAEIKNKLKELKMKEKELNKKKDKIKEEIKGLETLNIKENLLKEASEYYLSLNYDGLTFSDKKELIRRVVKEIRVSKDKDIDIYTW